MIFEFSLAAWLSWWCSYSSSNLLDELLWPSPPLQVRVILYDGCNWTSSPYLNQIHVRFMGTKVWAFHASSRVSHRTPGKVSRHHIIAFIMMRRLQEPAILLARLQACLTFHFPACNAKYLVSSMASSSWGKYARSNICMSRAKFVYICSTVKQ